MTTKGLRAMYNNLDIYGSDVFLTALKWSYKSVAYTNKSIPGQGSPCRSSKDIADNLTINRAIFHKNNEITVFTNHGNLRFF